MKNNKQITLEFETTAERDLWVKWYCRNGSNNFWGYMAGCGPKWWKTKSGLKWRKVAERRVDEWPKHNEKFVW